MHEVDKVGLHKTQEKIDADVNAPRPENVQQVRSFFGLVNYHHKFLSNSQNEVNNGSGSQDVGEAFIKVKEFIASDMVLTHYDPR